MLTIVFTTAFLFKFQRFQTFVLVSSPQVIVYLKGVEGLCSEAQPGRFSNGITIEVRPKEPASVKFVIIPLEAKRIPIEVYAITNSSGQYRDAVRKYLTVRVSSKCNWHSMQQNLAKVTN